MNDTAGLIDELLEELKKMKEARAVNSYAAIVLKEGLEKLKEELEK